MQQSDLVALLGRPLTSGEVTNVELYLEIAKESLEGLLCISTAKEDGATRTFTGREGYRTLFTGIFRSVSAVKVNGVTIDAADYYPAQWDSRNTSWYNSIVFSGRLSAGSNVDVTGNWGFDPLPADLKQLWAQLFANASKKYSAGSKVQSKQVEDFRITYSNDMTTDEQFMAENCRTIEKYSLCNVGMIRHGHIQCV